MTNGLRSPHFEDRYFRTYVKAHVKDVTDSATYVHAPSAGEFNLSLLNDKEYIATRIAHKLGLRGPAVSINTACSTSLVAVVQAVNSLRLGQCDTAIAGGVAVTCPPRSGYLYQEGNMLSSDGHTRSFDADGSGTVFSDGAAFVLLKRLEDAQASGDHVMAVIRGVAVNNDGADKASFTAPSADGQAEVIAEVHAHLDAGGEEELIEFIEPLEEGEPPLCLCVIDAGVRRDGRDVGAMAATPTGARQRAPRAVPPGVRRAPHGREAPVGAARLRPIHLAAVAPPGRRALQR